MWFIMHVEFVGEFFNCTKSKKPIVYNYCIPSLPTSIQLLAGLTYPQLHFFYILLPLTMHSIAAASQPRLSQMEPKWFMYGFIYIQFACSSFRRTLSLLRFHLNRRRPLKLMVTSVCPRLLNMINDFVLLRF